MTTTSNADRDKGFWFVIAAVVRPSTDSGFFTYQRWSHTTRDEPPTALVGLCRATYEFLETVWTKETTSIFVVGYHVGLGRSEPPGGWAAGFHAYDVDGWGDGEAVIGECYRLFVMGHDALESKIPQLDVRLRV